jgi:hypothetical protein
LKCRRVGLVEIDASEDEADTTGSSGQRVDVDADVRSGVTGRRGENVGGDSFSGWIGES